MKLGWWKRELSRNRDSLGEGRGGILIIEDIHCRKLRAELRAGCCKLEVELGRWRGTKKEDRTCKLCGEGIEDSNHFLTICAKLEMHRVWMEEEDNKAGDMFLSKLKVPIVARNVNK